jgi:hypothetical protein
VLVHAAAGMPVWGTPVCTSVNNLRGLCTSVKDFVIYEDFDANILAVYEDFDAGALGRTLTLILRSLCIHSIRSLRIYSLRSL